MCRAFQLNKVYLDYPVRSRLGAGDDPSQIPDSQLSRAVVQSSAGARICWMRSAS